MKDRLNCRPGWLAVCWIDWSKRPDTGWTSTRGGSIALVSANRQSINQTARLQVRLRRCPSDRLNRLWGPVQLVLTRKFRRETLVQLAQRQVQLVLVIEFHGWSWSSTQLKKLNWAEEVHLSWRSSTQLKKLNQLKKFNSAEKAKLFFNKNTLRFSILTTVEHRVSKEFWLSK
jgi:hypothetical protein